MQKRMNLYRIFSQVYFIMKAYYKYPLNSLLLFGSSIIFIVFAHFVGGIGSSEEVLLGLIISMPIYMGITSVPQFLNALRIGKIYEMFLIAFRHHIIYYLLGVTIGFQIYIFSSALPIIALITLLIKPTIDKIAIIVIIALFSGSIGALLGAIIFKLVKSHLNITPLSLLIGMLVAYLPPVLYPLSNVDNQLLQYIFLLVPSVPLAALLREWLGMEKLLSAWILIIIIFLQFFLLIILAKKVYEVSEEFE